MAAKQKQREAKAPQPEPWEPDPTWHQARREAFVAYRDAEHRTYDAVALTLRKSASLLRRWSDEDDWKARVGQWDKEQDRRKREAFLESNEQHGQVVAEQAAEFQLALLVPARAVIDRIEKLRAEGKDPFDGESLPELIRLAGTAGRAFAQVATVDRLARGLSTENVGGHDGGPLRVAAEVAAKPMAELEAYLLGREEEREAAKTKQGARVPA